MIRVLCWNFISSNFELLCAVNRFIVIAFSGQGVFMKQVIHFPLIFVII